MIWLLTILIILYLTLMIFLLMGWESLPLFTANDEENASTFITVIIPARNEEQGIQRILKDLSEQTYPHALFEVIVVDDSSEDHTAEIVNRFSLNKKISLTLISLKDIGKTGKKNAIEQAIQISKGNLIVCTDADCRAGSDWLLTIEDYYRKTGAKMICGAVCFEPADSFWKKMQQIEFASLIGTAGASLAVRFPNMCNGANIAYEKKIFMEVGGFSGNEDIASGDDEFLMHKISRLYPGKIKFLKSPQAVIQTLPADSLPVFLDQRIRWAGKWKNYTIKGPKILAGFIFLFNLALLTGWVSVCTGYLDPLLFLQQIVIKILFEFVFLKRVMALFRKNPAIFPFLVVELVYPVYVIVTVFLTFKGRYRWKGRTIKKLNLDRSGI